MKYEAQIEHYMEYIKKNPGWEFAGIYAGDGISGTNTKKRDEFNRLIEDCMADLIDMVVTKSISRFARNTLDCLYYIRQLKDKGIPVYFVKENINTVEAQGEPFTECKAGTQISLSGRKGAGLSISHLEPRRYLSPGGSFPVQVSLLR